jgi:hypothetical protein
MLSEFMVIDPGCRYVKGERIEVLRLNLGSQFDEKGFQHLEYVFIEVVSVGTP